ncbi:MAG TPA: hypothetical protein VH559_08115, partial [Gemmatimonadaceae bacterium]
MFAFHVRPLRLAAAVLVASAGSVAGQIPASVQVQQAASAASRVTPSQYFSADDALEINTYSIADVTDDGKWIALTQAVRRDGFGNDYRRDGDPTYVRPALVRLWSVDARSGQRVAIFPDKKAVRGMRWSPDGSLLGMLVLNNDAYEPAVWNRATHKIATLKLPAGKYVAETSDLRWIGNGTVVVALHTSEWKKKAQDTFKNITAGPVFVQNSKDPFLSWDDLRRMSARRSVGAIDVKTGQYRELIPEAQLTTFNLAEDGSWLTYGEDQTKKTEYE